MKVQTSCLFKNNIFPSIQGRIQGSKRLVDGLGVAFFNPNLGWMFFHAFFLQRCVQCMTPLTHFGVDTENLATSHLSLWKTYQKILHSVRHGLSITNDQLDFSISVGEGRADSSEV